MQIVVLLIILVVLAVFAKPKNPKYYRIATGSILGIAYFSLWNFVKYYSQIFEWDQNAVSTALISIAIVAAAICYLPPITRINQVGTIALLIVFVLTTFLSFTFEHEIKYIIADKAGYFDAKNPIALVSNNRDTRMFEFKKGGYSVEIPNAWSEHQYKNSEYAYFLMEKNGNTLAELRPKCFHKAELALPEIILNLTKQTHTEGQNKLDSRCFRWQDNFSACLVRSQELGTPKPNSRWRWLAANRISNQGIELDFVITDGSPEVLEDVQNIIGSLKVTALPEPLPDCFTPADWL